jgi:undecaprenyl-diphosphatase
MQSDADASGKSGERRWPPFTWQWWTGHLWLAAVIIGAGLALLAFAAVADEMSEGELRPLDLWAIRAVQPYHSPGMDTAAKSLSNLLEWPYIAVILAVFVTYLLVKRRFAVAAVSVGVVHATWAVVDTLKLLFSRPRPVHSLVHALGYSFPSGHASLSMVVYGLAGYIAWRYMVRSRWARAVVTVVSVLLILGTGLSRVFLGVHYLSDVLGGWAAGAFIIFGVVIVLEALYREWPGRLWRSLRPSSGT